MKYLLDVNAPVALGLVEHEFHRRVTSWLRKEKSPQLATCSITELGFIRIVAQTPTYGLSVAHARNLLLAMKQQLDPSELSFVADDQDVSNLPTWVRTAKQITDGHLVRLAARHEAVLATLDEKIPGAYLIPV
jgi:predicted nucleic acid-binding protein